jgi:hypothetical protein
MSSYGRLARVGSGRRNAANRNIAESKAWLSPTAAPLAKGSRTHFRAVVQTVGFWPGRIDKALFFQLGSTDTLSSAIKRLRENPVNQVLLHARRLCVAPKVVPNLPRQAEISISTNGLNDHGRAQRVFRRGAHLCDSERACVSASPTKLVALLRCRVDRTSEALVDLEDIILGMLLHPEGKGATRKARSGRARPAR